MEQKHRLFPELVGFYLGHVEIKAKDVSCHTNASQNWVPTMAHLAVDITIKDAHGT